MDDLLEIPSSSAHAGAPPPRPVDTTSIPALLKAFSAEWDSSVLAQYELQKKLDAAQLELSLALYRHDAAIRVVARLVQERDSARAALMNLQAGARKDESINVAMDDVQEMAVPLPEEIASSMEKTAQELFQARKKRRLSKSLATTDAIKLLDATLSANLHGSPPGVACMTLHPSDASTVITGGNDGNVLVYSTAGKGAIVAELVGHTAKVTGVACQDGLIVSGSADKSVRVWRVGGTRGKKKTQFSETLRFDVFEDVVTGVAMHPQGKVAVAVSRGGSYAVLGLDAQEPLRVVRGSTAWTSVAMHPDGLLVGLGDATGTVSVVDLLTGAVQFTLDAHTGGVRSLDFSEIGYHLVTAGADETVKYWDIRKSKCTHTERLPDNFGVQTVAFDHSGTYVAVGGADVRVYTGKTMSHIKTWAAHAEPVTGVAFGEDAHTLVTVSADKTIRVFG